MTDVDETLLLSWDRRKGKPKGPDRAALSASTGVQIDEDLHKFYLRKVQGRKEPQGVPLAFGSAAHDAMEAYHNGEDPITEFRSSLSEQWDDVDDRTVRYNPNDPSNPRDKQTFEVKLEDLQEKGQSILEPFFAVLEQGDDRIIKAQRNPVSTERRIGEIAKEAGRPYNTIYAWDWEKNEMADREVAVIAGVPVRGKADLVADWDGEGQVLIDYKCVSSVVPYYPTGRTRKRYDPRYSVKSSPQLDLYSAATGIARSGFQFMMKYPQYLPDDGVLYPDWVPESQWQGDGIPMSWSRSWDNALRYVSLWRPQPSDHPSAPEDYQIDQITARAAAYIRPLAERVTESFLLLEDGVEPHLAFPPGDPDVIGMKACPYCHFGRKGWCAQPRRARPDPLKEWSVEQYQSHINRREEIIDDHKQIQNLRRHWAETYR